MNPETPQSVPPITTSTSSTPIISEAASPAAPNYVGNSNIIDRPNDPSVYPTAGRTPLSTTPIASLPTLEDSNYQSGSTMYEALALVLVFGSSPAWLGAAYLSKSNTVALITALVAACASIVFGVIDYRNGRRLTPLQVIGMCGATLTLVLIADYYIVKLMIHSALSNLSGY